MFTSSLLIKHLKENGHTLDVRRLLEYVQYDVRLWQRRDKYEPDEYEWRA